MRAFLAFLACVVLLAAVVGGAEIVARRALDDRVQATAVTVLKQASSDGRGFATVTADHSGWALPDIGRGTLTGIDAVAADGELGGLRVDRLTLTAGPIHLDTREADSVQVVATLGPQAVIDVVETSGGLSGATVAVLAADTIRVSAILQGSAVVIDLRLAAEGGGIVALPVSATANGQPLDPASMLPPRLELLPAASLPGAVLATGVEASSGPGGQGAVVDLRFDCNSGCGVG